MGEILGLVPSMHLDFSGLRELKVIQMSNSEQLILQRVWLRLDRSA